MQRPPSILIFDLDGTLADSKQVMSPTMGALLSQVMRYIPVAIMSGGSFEQFDTQLLPSLQEDARLDRLYLFPVSAAQCLVYRNKKWRPQYDHSFSPQEREKVLGALHEALRFTGLSVPPPKVWGNQIEDRGAQITWSALGQLAPIDEKQRWDPDRKKRMPLRDALLRILPTVSVGVNAMTSIDITRKGINKAYGVRRLHELTGIPIAHMLYVGDALEEGGNDAVVHETGVPTHDVLGPQETAMLIENILHLIRASEPKKLATA